jgi:dihydrofolate synthase/folylpolyglutamate synthase
MLTYEAALDYLYRFVDYSRTQPTNYSAATFDLSRMVALMAALGHPEWRYPALHIAGTKGKGSVAALCASALHAGGYRVGLYTSPHLLDFCERAQINGVPIPRAAAAEIVAQLQAVEPTVPGLTTFELTTALAFAYFSRENVDVAVLEVGLGGRLDATNIVTPLVSVITALSYDHQPLLGHTLAEIAAEKGGIIKPTVPLVTAPQAPEALTVLEQIAQERGSALTLIGRDWLTRPGSRALAGQTFQIWSATDEAALTALHAQGRALGWLPTTLETPLLGPHQIENAAVAYAALQVARTRGLPLTEAAIAKGFARVRWPGRFEILGRAPWVVADGAHNHASAQRLAATARDYFPTQPLTLIFGASADKDVRGMLTELLDPSVNIHRVFLAQAAHPRACDPAELAALCHRLHPALPARVIPSVREALAEALATAAEDDVILGTGSLFLVAEIQAAYRELAPTTA